MSTELPPLFQHIKPPECFEPFHVLKLEFETPAGRYVAMQCLRYWNDPTVCDLEFRAAVDDILRKTRTFLWKKHGLQYVI